jgi:3D (Asp-Asp-Asp) domain-containing protein
MKTVNQKIEEAKANLEKDEKRDNKGKYRKLTIVERCGKWTIGWVILWSATAGGTWTYAIDHRNELVGTRTIAIEVAHAETANDTKSDENTAERKIESLNGEFTAYSAGDGYTPGIIMASTKEVYEGAMACPSKYAFGTKIKVGGKTYTCEDRMAKRFRDGEYFDIYMADQDKALGFGRQQLTYETIK